MPEPEKKQPAPPPEQTVSEDPAKSFKDKEEEMIEALETAYKEPVSAGNPALQEIAMGNLNRKKAEHKQAISALFERRRKEFEEKIINENVTNREALAQEILNSTEKEARKGIDLVTTLLESSKGEKAYMDDAAVNKFLADCKNIEKLANGDKQAEKIAYKLLQKERLTGMDYEYIVSIINPFDIMAHVTGSEDMLSATNATILIGYMDGGQREELMVRFMDSGKRAETPKLIDAFIRTRVLDKARADKLLDIAVQKGIISRQQYQADFKAKFDDGYYAAETKRYEVEMKKAMDKIPSGNYANGTMDRVFGWPLIGGLMAFWGAMTTVLNVAANWTNKKDWVKNPYIYMGGAAMLAGTEIVTGTMKQGAPVIGGGVIGRALEKIAKPEEDKESELEKDNKALLADIIDPYKSPAELIGYLDGGGYENLQGLLSQKLQKGEKGQKLVITIDELIVRDNDPEQIRRLKNLKTKSKEVQDSVTVKLNQVAQAGKSVFSIETNEDFGNLLAEIRSSRVPAAGASSADTKGQAAPPIAPESPPIAPTEPSPDSNA